MNRTPLHAQHVALGARMTEFGGWDMPVWYAGIPAEHTAVRTAVGLFDVCHMGEFVVHGKGATAALRRLLTNDCAELKAGEAHYTLLPNADGGTVDDLLVYRLEEEVYILVVNAGTIDKDRVWLLDQLRRIGSRAKLDDRSDEHGLLALQGPKALDILAGLTDLDVRSMAYYGFDRGPVAGYQALVSRTGYTGEDGFEIMLANDDAPALWDVLLEAGAPHGIQPCGLGARDSLRLEAAMPLYGHELDDETSALEAGLSRFVKLDKEGLDGPAVGIERLRREATEGVPRKLVGLVLEDRGIARDGMAILVDGQPVGRVTSGALTPTLDKAIALGYVPPANGAVDTVVAVDIRGRAVPARIVRRPFYKRPRS
ncbi:MAG: glycine cleavage system aminomethyltransferase GcvT [Ardenticatenales bacterium]|nr:glycine cleavage system aminomethyltransferase GcvT [Ardenticatenales bacterium]